MATDPNPGVPAPEEAVVLRSTLGALLRKLRTEARVSTRTLAARSAVARSTITRLEAGQRRPRPAILAALAYGLDPDRAPELAERLGEAAGPSLRPDTEGGQRKAARRRRAREKAVERRVDEIHRRAGALLLRSNRLTQATLRLLHPHADFEAIDLAGRLHQEALLLQEEGLRLDDIACSPRHPLADPPSV
ncbi:helix-turn-helix domain-containing protein [Nocardiopsis sp. NPDC101807]|uniref:helix-turn-helix domain-containing protein n=1 Tax=Nocardiopsis sp. NPDC101807 TaxID=3364339 RepID=UPI003823A157